MTIQTNIGIFSSIDEILPFFKAIVRQANKGRNILFARGKVDKLFL
jgi:hypothetical protein